MATGSNYLSTHIAKKIIGDNSANTPGGALLQSGANRQDASPSGDTWLYYDTLGGTSSYWGIKHNQGNNDISFYGAGALSATIHLNKGINYLGGKLGIGTTNPGNYDLYVNGTGYFANKLHLGQYTYIAKGSVQGASVAAGNGTYPMTFPTSSNENDNALILYASHSSSDFGVFYLSPDTALVANSGDNGYVFRVIDKDGYGTTGGSAEDTTKGLMLGVKQGNGGVEVASDFYPLTDNNRTLGTSSLKWSAAYATTFYGALSGNATTSTTATMPAGFTSQSTNAGWGNQTGTTVTTWNEGNGGSIDFRRDNPSSGKLSIKVDGRFYGNEGNYPTMLMQNKNSYWGMADPDGTDTVWIRTTTQGIIPYQSGGHLSGHQSLGTSTWYFSTSYIDNMYGRLAGQLSSASHNITLSASTWAASNPWSATNRTLVWGQKGVNTSYSSDSADLTLFYGNTSASGGAGWFLHIDGGIYTLGGVFGAVWNDYAECRLSDSIEPGHCVVETKTGIMTLSTERLQAGCKIISDTYGYCLGYIEDEHQRAPIAVSGRVLVYPYQDREKYELGAAVCSAPDGTVDIMTREEIMMYPERIVGTVSEIPEYDVWYAAGGKESDKKSVPIQVDGRIWIYVR